MGALVITVTPRVTVATAPMVTTATAAMAPRLITGRTDRRRVIAATARTATITRAGLIRMRGVAEALTPPTALTGLCTPVAAVTTTPPDRPTTTEAARPPPAAPPTT